MNDPPLVSLILCVKNGMPYLPEAVRSALNQSYRPIEIVVQDGNSSDASLAAIKEVGSPLVHVRSEPDGGVGDAYNKALARCSGDIVGTIDADNLMADGAIEAAVGTFVARPATAVVIGNTWVINEQGDRVQELPSKPLDLIDVLQCHQVPAFASSFFSRDACGDLLRFEESMKTCVDFDLWLRIAHLPMVPLPHTVSITRLSDKSMSRIPSNYQRFCDDKVAALRRYFSDLPRHHLLERIERHSEAGIYMWATESVLELEGVSDRFEELLERTRSLTPFSPRLALLDERAQGASRSRSGLLGMVRAHRSGSK